MCYNVGKDEEQMCWVMPEMTPEEHAEIEAHIAKLLAEADALDSWEGDGGR